MEKIILDLLLGGVAYSPPATVYFVLSTAAYSDAATGASCSEVSAAGTGYARVAVTNNLTNFPAATGTNPTTKSNANSITFPAATASWGTVQSFYVADAASAGNILFGADLGAPKTINTGDTASFSPGTAQLQED